MSKKNICITFLFLIISFCGFSQLTLSGVDLTLSNDVLLYSSDDVLVYNTITDTSKIEVKDNSELLTASDIINDGIIYNQGFVEGDNYVSVSDTSVLANEGEVIITGDFDTELGVYTGSGTSSVSFTGGSNHYVRSDDHNQFRLLVIDDGDVIMETDFVAANVQFNSSKIVCNGNRLGVLEDISGYNANSYVEGLLARVVKSGDYIMPVGVSSYYRPAKITGVTDSTLVFMEVYGGTFDLDEYGELKEVDEGIVWDYYSDSTTYANLSSPFKIGVAYDVNDFTEIGINTSNHRIAISDTTKSGFYSFGGTAGGVIASGLTTLYSVDDVPASGLISIGETCSLNEFAVSAMLEGPYNGTSGLMDASLTTELKNEFEFGGTSTLNMRQGFTVPTNAVDVIRIVLRDDVTLSRVDTAYAWLMRDGGTKDFETGQKTHVGFCDVSSSDFYLQLEHRNHLSIMSSVSYGKVASITSVDFKNASNVYGVGFTTGYNNVTFNNDVLMYSGDNKKSPLNVINAIDYIEIINVMGSLPSGYLRTDLNLSGGIESGDNDLGLDNSSWLRKSTVR